MLELELLLELLPTMLELLLELFPTTELEELEGLEELLLEDELAFCPLEELLLLEELLGLLSERDAEEIE